MNCLNISENIILLRRKKGITQEELATFLNVTKASVSKWETKQSYPDILLLPQLAAYFGVSIDDLVGYKPQMSPEQIKKCYLKLADDFAKLPFDEVMEKSRELVKEYYSCYPLVMQIANLWMNHFMLAPDKEKMDGVLKEIIGLCSHVFFNSGDMGLGSNALALKAVANLSLGNTKEVIEELEPIFETKQFMFQTESVLIQAYRMRGDASKSNLYGQIIIYMNLLNLMSNSIGMIASNMGDADWCEMTINRLRKIIDAYDLEQLNPNTALQFHYQTAVFYCVQSKPDEALEELRLFVTGCLRFIEEGIYLHGDKYFNRLEEWFDELPLKTEAPRNEKVIFDSLLPAVENPALAALFDTEGYKELKKKIESRKEEN